MQILSAEGQRIVGDVAQRHGFSFDAVATMLQAVAAGYGTQAQFNHFEFGGMGQWSQGGMIMIGDMFNNNLKYRVDGLCNELSGILANSNLYDPPPRPAQSQQQSQGGGSFQSQGGSYQSQGSGNFQVSGQGTSLFVPGPSSMNWWPSDLGNPSSTGAQNNLRYAVFPSTRRLAIDNNGSITVYDIGDHQIGGFSQQQGGDQSITFTSQFGTVRVADLPVVSPAGQQQSKPPEPSFNAPLQNAPMQAPQQNSTQQVPLQNVADQTSSTSMGSSSAPSNVPATADAIFATIERLADLRKKEIISDAEFETKKSELLSRL